ncbi:MAG: hypothetical protein ACYSOL_00865, partial [Planctomycetota bacterium]
MVSHPLTFLVGYLVATFIVSFLVVGPLGVFISMLFRRRMEKCYTQGLYMGISMTSFAFMILHYLLYLCGYAVTDWSSLLKDIF